jgi:tyrosyl-tRNA synthetase
LHLGNLITIISLARLSLHKIDPIFLVGGATGLIGDPSGKSK